MQALSEMAWATIREPTKWARRPWISRKYKLYKLPYSVLEPQRCSERIFVVWRVLGRTIINLGFDEDGQPSETYFQSPLEQGSTCFCSFQVRIFYKRQRCHSEEHTQLIARRITKTRFRYRMAVRHWEPPRERNNWKIQAAIFGDGLIIYPRNVQ